MSTKIDTVTTVVKRHDEVTFPEIQKELKNQSNTLTRIESKHNQDYLQFVEEKTKIVNIIVPLEDYVANNKNIKAEEKKNWGEMTKHGITSTTTLILAWIAYKLGITK